MRNPLVVATAALRRRLSPARRPARHARKAPSVGWIGRLCPEDGYGFIETFDGRDLLFRSDVVASGGFERLRVGLEVWFTEAAGEGGAEVAAVGPLKHSRGIVEPPVTS
jgi:cold shock CspA family protein